MRGLIRIARSWRVLLLAGVGVPAGFAVMSYARGEGVENLAWWLILGLVIGLGLLLTRERLKREEHPSGADYDHTV